MKSHSIFSRITRGFRGLLHSPQTPPFAEFAGTTYALEGEDIILERLFLGRTNGFYIDVGAHHPAKYSNTLKLHLRGWSGINIDCSQSAIELFSSHRPEDVNICALIGMAASETTLFVFEEGALTTMDPVLAARYAEAGYTYTRQLSPVLPLADVIKRHLPRGQRVDLLNIDVEGADELVLRSNDWNVCAPSVIAIELLDFSLKHHDASSAWKFLDSLGYELVAKTLSTCFFRKSGGSEEDVNAT